jgi:hypothetical protein
VIGKPMRFMKPEINSPGRKTSLSRRIFQPMLPERLTEPINDFCALVCIV